MKKYLIVFLAILFGVGVIIVAFSFLNAPKKVSQAELYSYFNEMKDYMDKGKYPEAIADLDKIIEYAPNDPVLLSSAYQQRGMCSYLQDDFDQAEIDFNKSIKIKPDYKTPYYFLADINKKKNPDQAISYLEKGLSLDPDNNHQPTNNNFLELESSVYGYLHNDEKIVEVNTRIITLDQSDAQAYLSRGFGYINLKGESTI